MVPEVIPIAAMKKGTGTVQHYPGIKEDVYASSFVPDAQRQRASRDFSAGDLVALARPPATEAHYHNPESEALFVFATLELLVGQPSVRILFCPRNARQEAAIWQNWPALLESNRVQIPKHAEDGLNLIWHSDLVVSGGGTMNREAAALGVPATAYSADGFGGKHHYLARTNRLILLESVEDVRTRIRLERREPLPAPARRRNRRSQL